MHLKWGLNCRKTPKYDNKNTLETCKNPRPTSGWSELTKSCTTSTMNFHMAYFSWIPQNNAKFKLSCKFGESKCNPCWHITLTTSHGMDYVLNEHLNFMPTWHICNIISDNIVIQLTWKFQESNWNPDWFIALMDSFDTNYIFTKNKKSWPIWPKCNTIPDNAMLQLSWKFG